MAHDGLTELFRKLGARDPALWAASQRQEGIDQVARFVFLRQAWRCSVDPDDPTWIDRWIERADEHPDAPCAGIGPALRRLLSAGADRNDVREVVRVMQYELLFALCYLLSDPGELEPELEDLGWALVRVDAAGEVVGPIGCLHESVLETDPTGREMRPPRTP